MAEAPLLALVAVAAGAVVGRQRQAGRAGARAARRRRHALVLAAQRRARRRRWKYKRYFLLSTYAIEYLRCDKYSQRLFENCVVTSARQVVFDPPALRLIRVPNRK